MRSLMLQPRVALVCVLLLLLPGYVGAYPVSLISENALHQARLRTESAQVAESQRITVQPVADQPAMPGLRVNVKEKPKRDFNVQLNLPTNAAVGSGDLVRASVWARTIESADETGEGFVSLVVEWNREPHTKLIQQQQSIGRQWTRLEFYGRNDSAQQPGGLQATLRVGAAKQIVELAGWEVVNLGPDAQPPKREIDTNYPGRAADAPWRMEAQKRIEQIRMSDLIVQVVDAKGQPVEGAKVRLEMTRHAFPFGCVYNTEWLTVKADTPDGRRYQQMFKQLFNIAVDEGTMKWREWVVPHLRQRGEAGVQWCNDNNIPVRGHTLVWPSWQRSPNRVRELAGNPKALNQAVLDRITEAVTTFRGKVITWDVVNEPMTHHDILDIVGEEKMIDWFKAARAADPDVRLVLNETTRGSMSPQGIESFRRFIRLLIDGGAPLDAIGFQSHFGSNARNPEELLRILDRFHTEFGLPMEITEFDFAGHDEAHQADFTRDMLTLSFSHPGVETFLFWGFWEGRHWKPERAMWRKDWSIKPAGQTYLDLVFGKWWTKADGSTDTAGRYQVRGYQGDYSVHVTLGDKHLQRNIRLPKQGATLTITVE